MLKKAKDDKIPERLKKFIDSVDRKNMLKNCKDSKACVLLEGEGI